MKKLQGTKIPAIIIFSCLFMAGLPEIYAESKEIVVGVYDNKPLVFLTETGPQGLFIDVLENIAKKEDWKITYRRGSWEDIYNQLITGKIDLLPVVALTESRAAQFDFSEEPLISNWGQVYTRKGLAMESIQDLEGKKIAVLSNDTHGEAFTILLNQLGISYEQIIIENYQELFEKLESGKLDAGVFNYIFSKIHSGNYDIQSTPIVFNPIQIHYAVPKGDPADLLVSLDRYIRGFKEEKLSVYQNSMARWFGNDFSGSERIPPWLKWFLSAIFIMIALLVGGNIILRIQVRAKTRELLNDIARRKKAEEQLRNVSDNWQETFNAIEDFILVLSPDHEILEINKAGLTSLNKTREEVAGKKCYHLVHNTDLPIQGCPCDISLKEKRTVVNEYSQNDRIYELIAWPVFNDRKEITKFIHIVKDITNRRQAEEEQKKLQSQLNQAQKMESVGRLAGGVAHDFNNMLGVIIGHAEMAMAGIGSAEPISDNLKEIHSAASRSADLTRQLLAFARKQTVSPVVQDLNRQIEGMLKMLSRLIGENIRLIWQPDESICRIKMDSSQLDQILTNLCVNAGDAIEGVGSLTIKTERCDIDVEGWGIKPDIIPGSYVLLSVKDDGLGMDPKTLENLFEPFFTTKAVGRGTGLGLSTVYGIVKQNNGFIEAESTLGTGSIFRVYLPCHAGNIEPKEEKKAGGTIKGDETILLVEDEPLILEMAKTILVNLGYTVIAASTPVEAVTRSDAHKGIIHLLISDVIMPEKNGRDLAAELLQKHPEMKTLFMSGYTADIISIRGTLDQEVNFIQKPFSTKDFSLKVRSLLDRDKEVPSAPLSL